MNEVVALLVSRCPAVIEQVRGIASAIPQLRVEVTSAANVSSRTQQAGVGLILAHLEDGQDSGITRLLWSVAQALPCPTIVLCDRFKEHQATALLRAGAAHYIDVQSEPVRLDVLLQVLTHKLCAGSPLLGSTTAAKAPEGFCCGEVSSPEMNGGSRAPSQFLSETKIFPPSIREKGPSG